MPTHMDTHEHIYATSYICLYPHICDRFGTIDRKLMRVPFQNQYGQGYVERGLSLFAGLNEDTLELRTPNEADDTEELQRIQISLEKDDDLKDSIQARCDELWTKFGDKRWGMAMLLVVHAQTNTVGKNSYHYHSIPGNTYADKFRFMMKAVSKKTLAVFFSGMVLDVAKRPGSPGGIAAQPYMTDKVSGEPSTMMKNEFVCDTVEERILPWLVTMERHAEKYTQMTMTLRKLAFQVRRNIVKSMMCMLSNCSLL